MRKSRRIAGLTGDQANRQRWPFFTTADLNLSASQPATVTVNTNGSTAHTVGSWTQVTASLAADANWVLMRVSGVASGSTDTRMLLNVGTGGAGSEVTVVPNLNVGGALTLTLFSFPLRLAKGTRVAVQSQGVILNDTASVQMAFLNLPGFVAPPYLISLGADTATSKGTIPTLPGSTNTMGAWTQITSSCPAPLMGVFASAGINGSVSNFANATTMDVGIGSAGNEVLFAAGVYTGTQTNAEDTFILQPGQMPRAANIPLGARVSIRYQLNNLSHPQDFVLHGIPYV